MYPTVILHNVKLDRFHPMPFRMYPMPGGSDLPRYKSIGHHTEGFETLEQAKEYISKNHDFKNTNELWPWDGESSPHSVHFF